MLCARCHSHSYIGAIVMASWWVLHELEYSVSCPAVYQTEGEDFDGNVKYFKKPWASTALMFFAMVFCLPIAWIASAIERRRKRGVARDGKHEPLLQQEGEQSDGTESLCHNSVIANQLIVNVQHIIAMRYLT